MKIRAAEWNDLPQLIAMGREFWATLNHPAPYDEDGVVGVFERMVSDHIVLVAMGDTGRLAGFIGAVVGPLGFAKGTQATEVAYYMTPAARGAGRVLLIAAEARARQMGVDYFNMVSMDALRQDGVDRAGALYERMGYSPSETFWRKAL